MSQRAKQQAKLSSALQSTMFHRPVMLTITLPVPLPSSIAGVAGLSAQL